MEKKNGYTTVVYNISINEISKSLNTVTTGTDGKIESSWPGALFPIMLSMCKACAVTSKNLLAVTVVLIRRGFVF